MWFSCQYRGSYVNIEAQRSIQRLRGQYRGSRGQYSGLEVNTVVQKSIQWFRIQASTSSRSQLFIGESEQQLNV